MGNDHVWMLRLNDRRRQDESSKVRCGRAPSALRCHTLAFAAIVSWGEGSRPRLTNGGRDDRCLPKEFGSLGQRTRRMG